MTTMLARAIMAGSAGLYPKLAGGRAPKRRVKPITKVRRAASKTAKRAKVGGVMRKGSAAAKAWGRKMKRLRARRG